MVVGTPAYQAPEALDDSYASDEDWPEVPQKEDIWALGVTMYQLLYRRLPFPGGTLFEIVNRIKEMPLEIPEGTDPVIEKLLRGMLTVDPMNRLGIDDHIAHPLFRDAPDRAVDLPPGPTQPPRAMEGAITELVGEPCGRGCAIADLMIVPRRSSYAAHDVLRMGRRLGKGANSTLLLTEDGKEVPYRKPRASLDFTPKD
jgi:serine/threonine protein kinase